MNALNSGTPSRRWVRGLVIAAVAVVPLAFAGLVVGAVSDSESASERIPAAIVNNDELLYQTAADGTETPVFAGRLLVTELTGAEDGFDWVITNDADAAAALDAGEVYAVVTIPETFSESLTSIQGDDPQAAELAIRTDDSHSYLTGSLSQAIGDSMAATFGRAITEQFIAGIYTGIGDLGGSLQTAADGAGKLSAGAGELGSGLGELAGGAATAGSGATQLSSGVSKYTAGVDALASGLSSLNSGAAGLGGVSAGVTQYTTNVSGFLGGLKPAYQAQLATELAKPVPDAATVTQLRTIIGTIDGLASGGSQLSQQTAGGIAAVQGGIAQSASGAAQLAAGSAALRSGASSLAGGLGDLSAGASAAATGATGLATGADELASGLAAGAEQVPVVDTDTADATAKVAAEPVTVTATRANEITDIGQALAAFFVPFGLWLGALAVFLVLRPVTRSALQSTATAGRLLLVSLARASAVTAVQAALLVALLHLTLGVSWSALPVTLGFSVLMALAFTAFHHLLSVAFGRAGLVVSLFVLAVQLTSTGGIYPVQLLAEPFQAISPLLPLTYGVSGMQAIIAGGSAGPVLAASAALLGFGLLSVLLSRAALRRRQRVQALALVPATA